MTRTSLSILLVVCLVLSGCASIGGDTNQTPSQTTTTTPTTTTSTTATTTTSTTPATTTTATSAPATTTSETTTTTTITTTTTTTTTATESRSEPTPPNTPLQNKMGSEEQNRIKDLDFVDKTEASGGYSDFDLKITADTRMENIDPADHGDVVGEPYFLVYIDGSLDNGSRFSYTNGTLGERLNVTQKESGEYTIDVHSEALKKAGVEEGEVEVMVLLMDKDSDWDDIYAVRKATIDYSSGK